jgi:hypothetical protein
MSQVYVIYVPKAEKFLSSMVVACLDQYLFISDACVGRSLGNVYPLLQGKCEADNGFERIGYETKMSAFLF